MLTSFEVRLEKGGRWDLTSALSSRPLGRAVASPNLFPRPISPMRSVPWPASAAMTCQGKRFSLFQRPLADSGAITMGHPQDPRRASTIHALHCQRGPRDSGRPFRRPKVSSEMSDLRRDPVAPASVSCWGKPVLKTDRLIGPDAKAKVAALRYALSAFIYVRFFAEEEKNDPGFRRQAGRPGPMSM